MSSSLFSLQGTTALVTGGTKGIGRSIAIGLAEAGADIILYQRNIDDTETQKQVEALGRKCHIVECDVSNEEQIVITTRRVLEEHPTISILVNSAGIQRRLPAATFPTQDFNDVLQTNLLAVFTTCRALGSHWLEKGQTGVIINVASLASFQGGVNMVAYSASKGAVLMMTKTLSNEWAGKGIRVNSIAPGYIATDLNKDTRTKPELKSYYESITSRIPMGRWGESDEMKGVAVFLASKASAYVTGECIVVDGGWMAR